jgi:hypothetical protein
MDHLNFTLTEKEMEEIRIWNDSLPKPVEDVFGKEYCYQYIFHPTGLGIIKLIRRLDGYELDLTDYSTF